MDLKQIHDNKAFLEHLTELGVLDENGYPAGDPGKNHLAAASFLAELFPMGIICSYCEKGFPLCFVSGELYGMMGYDSYEEFCAAIQGKVMNTVYYEDFALLFGGEWEQYSLGREYTSTYRMPRRDGSLFWVLDKSKVIETQEHRRAILSFRLDITGIMEQQLNMQQSVKELEQKNRELQYLNNTVPVGYHRCADMPDYDFLFVSNKFLNMLGYTRQEIKDLFDDKFKNMIHPDDWNKLFSGEKNMASIRHDGLYFEYRIKAKSGYIWVEDRTDYIEGMGKPFFQGAIMDITERVQLQERLTTSIKAFQIAAKEAENLVFTYNRKERTVYCDEWMARNFNVLEKQPGVPYEIVKKGSIVSKDTEAEYIRIYEEIIQGAKEAGGVVKLTDTAGREYVYEMMLQTVFDNHGQPTDLAVGIYKNITGQYLRIQELEQSQQSLQEKYRSAKEKLHMENRDHLDMIYALSQDYYALWRVDLQNDLIYLRRKENQRALVLPGRSRKIPESYSVSLRTFGEKWVHPDDRAMLYAEAGLERMRERLQTEEAYSVRLRRLEREGGEYGYVEWRIVRMDSRSQSHMALIAVKDVDGEVLQEMQHQELLKNALLQAKRANSAKTTFLSNMSHDIRTPMNAIIGFSNIAASHIDNKERVKDCLEKILSSSQHLLSLINDILDMSRIESGKITLQEKECNLSECIHNLVHMIHPQVRAKQLEFYVDTVDVSDEFLIFDPLKLDQILINILGNAVKFTPPGGKISFLIRQSPSDQPDYAHYEFVIQDTGIGMSPHFLKHIFEPFERENTSTLSGSGGTGLGMAITKNTVDVMGGTIQVESQPAKGSCFTVGFDFKRQDVSGRQEQLRELAGLRVLVLDDDLNSCDSVTKMLSQMGMRAEWTASGREAVFRAQKAQKEGDPFHIYMIDWLMPQMNGIETVRRIRRTAGKESLIIILTAYDWTDVEEEAMEAGVTAFCCKPLFLSDLRALLAEVIHPGQKKESVCSRPMRNFHHKRVLVVEDNELNREIAVEILNNFGLETESAPDGAAAVEMVRHSKEYYYDLVLMDIQMPVMDGYQATRKIRSLPRQDVSRFPIIAMTANAFEEDKRCALANGMNAHIAKPLSIDVLADTLSSFLPEDRQE